jgi:RimJ/RimL family protein N-acetyltransferase
VVESCEGTFLGYTGVMPVAADHPLGSHFDIGWRLVRRYWGFGYATEAARAALADAFQRLGLAEILAYIAPDNQRSQRVMERLGAATRSIARLRAYDQRLARLGMGR